MPVWPMSRFVHNPFIPSRPQADRPLSGKAMYKSAMYSKRRRLNSDGEAVKESHILLNEHVSIDPHTQAIATPSTCTSCHRVVYPTSGVMLHCADCNLPICVICARSCHPTNVAPSTTTTVATSVTPGNIRSPLNPADLNSPELPLTTTQRRKHEDEDVTEDQQGELSAYGCGRTLCRGCCVESPISHLTMCRKCTELGQPHPLSDKVQSQS